MMSLAHLFFIAAAAATAAASPTNHYREESDPYVFYVAVPDEATRVLTMSGPGHANLTVFAFERTPEGAWSVKSGGGLDERDRRWRIGTSSPRSVVWAHWGCLFVGSVSVNKL